MTETPSQPPSHLSVRRSTVDGVRVVALRGELDHAARVDLGDVLHPPGEEAPRTVADLSGVTFMDSSGINILIAAHRAAVQSEGWLRVVGAQPSVLRVLELVGLDLVIPCFPTLAQALES
ncbi:STAS domain-containing protein [Streptomyces griseoviridis]|uniref:STAS domain-containing protein n=1 Tax=Streptomyces TaxID=1883 RepID=UPI001F0C4878|nr:MULTISPECIES: STAS domain-containing protein [Streptomyces]MDH6697370.1 stage II sporulation protein AA (anti-sigma F factor antagonist) [Streptomyces sp. MAA16]